MSAERPTRSVRAERFARLMMGLFLVLAVVWALSDGGTALPFTLLQR